MHAATPGHPAWLSRLTWFPREPHFPPPQGSRFCEMHEVSANAELDKQGVGGELAEDFGPRERSPAQSPRVLGSASRRPA